jgi:hypothetical protein
MSGLRKKAADVVLEALASSTIFLDNANDHYFDRVKVEATGFVFPRLTKHWREKWWLGVVAHWYCKLTVQESEAALDLMVEKNKMYGNRQIYVIGTLGILIRSIDKLERIKNIDAGATSTLLAQESRHDSIQDLFNYAILAVLCIRKEL